MKSSRINTLLVVLVLIPATVLLPVVIGRASKPFAQDSQKSLDIERYPGEPLELVDLKIRDQSIKNQIKVKLRKDGEGLDEAKFHETGEWFTRVQVRLRNVSGKRIVGLRAYLYFKVPNTPTLFSMPLIRYRQLQVEPLEPCDEVDLMVDTQLWSQIAKVLKQHGDPDLSAVTLSVENVAFSDGLQWNRGYTLRRDPVTPNRWIPIDQPQ